MENTQLGIIGSGALAAMFLYSIAELLWLTVFRKQFAFKSYLDVIDTIAYKYIADEKHSAP